MNMTHDHSHDHSHANGGWGVCFQGSPQTMFLMGLFAGIAASALLVLSLLAWAIFGGKGLGSLSGTGTQPVQQVAQQPTGAQQPPEPAGGPVKPVDEASDHIRGPKNAKVTLIEYSDFECPFCARHHPTLEQVLKDYPKDVRLIYRHFPLSFHPSAQKLAEASECAAELGGQDAFWKYHDKIFTEVGAQTFTPDRIVGAGKDIGLNEAKFKSCVDSGKYAAKVAQDQNEGGSAGVNGTPATFVNGKLISGAVPLAALKAEIDAALKK